MDDELELVAVIMALFGLLTEMMVEINSLVIFMTFGFLFLRRRIHQPSRGGGRYSLRSKVTRQLDNMHYQVNYNDETCRDHIRKNSDCFNRLCCLLQNLGGLRSTRNVSISEQVAIFLTALSHLTKNRVVKHSFRRSGYTISKHFNGVLNTLLRLHRVLLAKPVPVPEDSTDYRWKYFKGYLSALDGSYIPVRVPHSDIPRYRNRKRNVSVNVLAICDQNMNYIYVLFGWEGSAADSRILRDAVTRTHRLKVPHVDKMDNNQKMPIASGGRKKNVTNCRRVWTYMEEKELVCALRDIVVKGLKCDNGFKSGYLNILENSLASKFPGTDLKGDPHINSKIHVWKKHYACLKTMLGNSGIGLNNTTFRIDALPEVWAAHIKAYVDAEQDVINQTTKNNRTTPSVENSFEVPNANEFTGSAAEFSSPNIGESSSATKHKSTGVKRKQVDDLVAQFIETLGGFCEKNDSRFGNIAETIGTIVERVGSEFDAIKKRGQVFELLDSIDNLTVEDRVIVSQFLCNNPMEMDLFVSLPDYAKTVLVKRIKTNLGDI
ncbi:hypothetical protein ACS0TY_002206 [Phlomoides rotata]